MKKILLISLFTLTCLCVKAQFINNINGNPVETKDFNDVKGSAYLNDDWGKGRVQLADNSIYNDLEVKYSQYEDKLYFKNKDGQTLSFAVPVKDFVITYTKDGNGEIAHYRNGYVNIPGITSDAYVEVIADGKTQLLKRTTKRIEERTEYPNTTSNKTFVTLTKYYIYKADNKATLVNKDKKSVMNALGDKQEQLEAYIKTNDLNIKKDEDLGKLITYYNSI